MIDTETWARMTADKLKRALDDQHAANLVLPSFEKENNSGGWSLTNHQLAERARWVATPPNPRKATPEERAEHAAMDRGRGEGWSGDLHELTWWFYKTPDWRWYFGRLKRDKSCWVFQVGRWGVHVRFKSE